MNSLLEKKATRIRKENKFQFAGSKSSLMTTSKKLWWKELLLLGEIVEWRISRSLSITARCLYCSKSGSNIYAKLSSTRQEKLKTKSQRRRIRSTKN